jgi:hypothetical protein
VFRFVPDRSSNWRSTRPLHRAQAEDVDPGASASRICSALRPQLEMQSQIVSECAGNLCEWIARQTARPQGRRSRSAQRVGPGLSSFLDRNLPSKQEKVAPAKSTSEGQPEPQQRFLDAVSDAYASKVDRSTVRTTFREHGLHVPPGGSTVALQAPPVGAGIRPGACRSNG